MAKGRPVGVDGPGGGDTVVNGGSSPGAATCATCCLNRSGTTDFTNRSFSRIFQQYGRSSQWFRSAAEARYSAAHVTWEDYYYRGTYGFRLDYQVRSATNGPANGTIAITLRVKPSLHATEPALRAAAPGLFRTVTEQTIADSVRGWNQSIQSHWTNRYTVRVGAPDCPGDFPIQFTLTRVSSGAHVEFSVLDMQNPRESAPLQAALGNPEDPRYGTATQLASEWRSNARKFNIGDSRGNLVFAHEFGHWMGWGDEYIEVRGSTADGRAYELRNNRQVSLRVAIKFDNPTKVYRDRAGTSIEVVDITTDAVVSNLMGSMTGPSYSKRCVYTIVHDFIALYNRNHYGGRNTAHCVDVLVRR